MVEKKRQILVAVDGSPQAQRAFVKGVQIARQSQGQLHLLAVLDIWNRDYQYDFKHDENRDGFTTQLVQRTEKQLQQLQADAHDLGLADCAYHIRFGNPRTVIAHDFVQDHQIELLLIGATGKGTVTRMLIGSTANYVTRVAPCDVLVVHSAL